MPVWVWVGSYPWLIAEHGVTGMIGPLLELMTTGAPGTWGSPSPGINDDSGVKSVQTRVGCCGCCIRGMTRKRARRGRGGGRRYKDPHGGFVVF